MNSIYQETGPRDEHSSSKATWKDALISAVPFLQGIIGVWAAAATWMRFNLGRTTLPSPPILSWATLGGVVFLLFGLMLIVGSIRELKHGRRPIWLATWLAASISMLTGVFYPMLARWLAATVGVIPSNSAYYMLFAMLATIGALAVWASWRSPKTRAVFIGFVLLGITGICIQSQSHG